MNMSHRLNYTDTDDAVTWVNWRDAADVVIHWCVNKKSCLM